MHAERRSKSTGQLRQSSSREPVGRKEARGNRASRKESRGHSAGSEQDGSPLIGRLTLALLFAMELELVVLHVGTRSGAETIAQARGGWRLLDDAL